MGLSAATIIVVVSKFLGHLHPFPMVGLVIVVVVESPESGKAPILLADVISGCKLTPASTLRWELELFQGLATDGAKKEDIALRNQFRG